MDAQGGLVVWILGGAGVLFLYAAYSKQHPAAVLGKTLNVATSTAAPKPSGPRESADGGPVPNRGTGTAVRGGVTYVTDAAGNPVGVAPAPYQGSKTFIPAPGGVYV